MINDQTIKIINNLLKLIAGYVTIYTLCPLFGKDISKKEIEFIRKPFIRTIIIFSYSKSVTNDFMLSSIIVFLFFFFNYYFKDNEEIE